MTAFRSGFKILGELTLRQSLGRIRSFSEDRKPGSWLPEDQWAVRPPCTTCPDPCKPKKPKSSKSWLSICRDPDPPLTCDIRHNNCPPPKTDDEPWYAFITKKKSEKPKPSLSACRAELQRQAEMSDEETCENLGEIRWPEPAPPCPPEEPVCKERQPAPVIRLSCPPPKELDLMLWCGRPGLSVARIASQCQTDRMPYDEFRPRKCWKPPPYSLPCKSEAPARQPFCCNLGRAPLAEYKQVEIPKPVYTRYKSVELEDENFLLCMTDARCSPDNSGPSLALEPPPIKKAKPPPQEPKPEPCPEKPILVAASRKPVKLKCGPKFKFRPKPTKLIEKRHFRNPCAQHSACNLTNIKPPEEEKPQSNWMSPCVGDPPKVITSNVTDEPQTYQRSIPSKKPPLWMFVLSKPGSDDTPLVPHLHRYPKEPDWCGETDGLKFYDGEDEGIFPKPPPDPFKDCPEQPTAPPPCPPKPEPQISVKSENEKFVLMPEKYNIRNMRPAEDKSKKDLSEATFQQFVDAKTANVKKCSKLYPQAKESILYDFVRNCPLPPMDPSQPEAPPRKPPEPECPQPTRFYYRRYSTFIPFRKPNHAKHINRTMSEDSREKCKARKLVPKPKECPPPVKGPSCDEMTLPACQKARIPPRCDVKKQPAPCKKRLAPKPSYSECSRDPPPCPRNTECNAWEKRAIENQKKGPPKGRKFSIWAPAEGHARGIQITNADSIEPSLNSRPTLTSQVLEPSGSDVNARGKPLNKNEETSPVNRKIFSGKGLIPNFLNPPEISDSYYTSENLVGRRRFQPWRKLKIEEKNIERSFGSQLHERKVITLLLQHHHTRNGARAKNLRVSHTDSGLGVYMDNTSPWNIIESIGRLISNSFLKVYAKRPHSAPPLVRMDQSLAKTYVETVDVDRIMILTKPLTDSIKPRGEKVRYCTVDPLAGNQVRSKLPLSFKQLWDGQWNQSLVIFPKMKKERARSSMWKFEALSPTVDEPGKQEHMSSDAKLLPARAGNGWEKPSRLPVRKLEEYPASTVENIGVSASLVNRNLRENPSPSRQLPGKYGFRYCKVPATSFHRGAATLLRQTETSLRKKEVALPSKSESFKFMQSPTSILVASVLAKKKSESWIASYAKKRISENAVDWKPCMSVDGGKKRKSKKLSENISYRTDWTDKWGKSNEDILESDFKYSADKRLKRKEVRNALSKLDGKMSSLKVPVEENDSSIKGDRRGNFLGVTKQAGMSLDEETAETVNTFTDVAEPSDMRVLTASLGTCDLARGLSNNLELHDDKPEVVLYENANPITIENRKGGTEKARKSSKRGNVRMTSYEKSSKNPISLIQKIEKSISTRPDTDSSKPNEATMKSEEFLGKPKDKKNKTSKKNFKDSDIQDKIEKDKPESGSNDGSSSNKSGGREGTCRHVTSKKPGPNCPNG